MLACTKSSKVMVELFIKNDASVSLSNKDGWTPFHLACRYACKYHVTIQVCIMY